MDSHDTPVFGGRAGTSHRRETAVYCGGCGLMFGATVQAGLDAAADPELLVALLDRGIAALNPVDCPACGWSSSAADPVLVHRPGEAFILVLPAAMRHRVRQAEAEALAQLVPAVGGVLPAYAQQLQVVAEGDADLAAALLPERVEPPTPAVVPLAPEDPLATNDVPLDALIEAVSRDAPALEQRGEPESAPESTPEIPPPLGGGSVEELPDVGGGAVLAELLRARPSAAPSRPTAPGLPQVESWQALDEGWSLDAAQAEPADDDPTHVVALESIAPRPPLQPFDEARAAEADAYLELGDEAVCAVMRLDAPAARRYRDDPVVVRFQVHHTMEGVTLGLLLGHLDAEGVVDDHLFWLVEPERADHADVLDMLEGEFVVEVRLYASNGELVTARRVQAPLEANVSSARAVAAQAAGDPVAARQVVASAGFDRVGRLRHNFTQDSFAQLESAAEARLALGILGYWSAPERRDYLLRVKSFPEIWFEAMTRRVLGAAIGFGLAMEPHLRQRALELELSPNSASLLRRSLANFAEVNLNLKPSGLDPLDLWDNWEALLAHAEELDLRVDEEIEELAARAMERARQAAQAAEPMEIHLADESVELEDVIELGELGDDDLVHLLQDPAHRLEATVALLQKADPVFVPAIFDAIKGMNRDELLQAVPAALAMGPAFEAHFLGGLRARRPSLRLASALFLSEIRSERATGPLLALLPSAAETEWPVLSRAAARMGRRILVPALDQVEAEGDAEGRVAHTLALLGGEARGALGAAQDQRKDARVRACLAAAIDRMNEVSFGDAADFSERLADAFAAAGPDRVGPDFEEVLESVDLGPGASLSGIETDVNLDGLD